MLKKIIRVLTHLSLIFLAVIIEVEVFKKMSFPFGEITVILPAIIYLMVVFNLNCALWWAAAGGFMLNLFSALPFGTLAIALAVAAAVTYKLFIRFFTNRSLYPLVFLTMLGTIIYKIIAVCLSFLPFILGNGIQIYYFNLYFFEKFLALVVANIFVVSIMFFATNLFSKRLKSVYVSIRNPIADKRFKN